LKGSERNLSRGFLWAERAAKKGDARAQYNLALAYLEGEGARQNLSRAKHWLKKAANQGHRRASTVLRGRVAKRLERNLRSRS